MNHSEKIYKQDWDRLATVSQLKGICVYYGLTHSENTTREKLFCLLDEANVHMEFSSYKGPQVNLHCAIIHWIEDSEASDADSSSSCNDGCPYGCLDSDDSSDKMNDTSTDTKVVGAAVAMHESCRLSDFDVQHEEEVEADEYIEK